MFDGLNGCLHNCPNAHPHPIPCTQRGLVADHAAAADPKALRATVQESFALTERDESFEYAYGGSGGDDEVGGWDHACTCCGGGPVSCVCVLLGRHEGVPNPVRCSHPPKPQRHVIRLQGWKKELGQQLDSTGLTMWRAGEDLGRYLYERCASLFQGGEGRKRVLELGCGLGLCGILAARLNPHGVVVLTDGDELTMGKV